MTKEELLSLFKQKCFELGDCVFAMDSLPARASKLKEDIQDIVNQINHLKEENEETKD